MAEQVLKLTFRADDKDVLASFKSQSHSADQLKSKLKEVGSPGGAQASASRLKQMFGNDDGRQLRILQKINQETAATQAEADAAILRQRGQNLQADLLLAQRNAEAKTAVVRQQLEAQLASTKYSEATKAELIEASEKRITAIKRNAAEQQALLMKRAADQEIATAKRAAEQEALAKRGGGEGGAIEQLKGSFGRGSSFDELGKILMGGGAVMGITAIADAIGRAAEKAGTLTGQLEAGKINAGDFADEILKSLPVFGSLYSAARSVGDAIHDWWTGEGAVKERLADEKLLMEQIGQEVDRQHEVIRTTADLIAHLGQRGETAGLQGQAKDLSDQDNSSANARTANREARQKAIAEENKGYASENDKLQSNGASADDIEKLTERHRLALATINKQYDALDRAQDDTDAKERAALVAQHHRDDENVLQQYLDQTSQLKAQAQEAQLKALGRDQEAEALSIRQAGEQKKAEIDKQLKEQLAGRNPLASSTWKIKKAAQAEKDSVDAGVDADLKAMRERNVKEQLNIIQQYNEQVTRIKSEAQQKQLRDQGRDQEAELLALKQGGDEKKAEIDKQLKEQLSHALLSQHKGLKAAAQAEKDAIDAGVKSDSEALVKRTERDAQRQALQDQSQYGATYKDRLSAKKQLAQLDIMDQLKKRAAAEEAILTGPSTAEQKKASKQRLLDFAKNAGHEYDKEVYGDRQSHATNFNAEDRGLLLSGVAASARTKRDPAEGTEKNTAEANTLTRQLISLVSQLAKGNGGGVAQQPQPVFG